MASCSERTTIQPAPTTNEAEDLTIEKKSAEVKIVWINVIFMITLHVMAFYGMMVLPQLKFPTMIWVAFCYYYGGMGITMGAHRLWAHKSYKAKWPLRFILMLANSMASQNDIFEWVRDHRVHHKYSETDADPHNAKRGFFFAHMGWLLQKKHPDVISKGKGLDLSDLYADGIVMFQKRYFKPISLTMCVVLPTIVPSLWGESLWLSYFTAFALRYICFLHATWSVNSIAHMIGDKPYDITINPVENKFVSYVTSGEGFHNYHHTFPQDYSTSEFGTKSNLTTKIINFCALIGWVYDRKTIPKDVIVKRMMRTGKLRNLDSDHEIQNDDTKKTE